MCEDLVGHAEGISMSSTAEGHAHNLGELIEDFFSCDPTSVALTKLIDESVKGSINAKKAADPTSIRAEGVFIAKKEGVLAGTLPASLSVQVLDTDAQVHWDVSEGELFSPGDSLGTVNGCLQALLCAERTALNFLCHLSGVATLARAFVEEARKHNSEVVVRDTRKTLPGLRLFEKEAVRAGGAANHRIGLYDGILVKDNHLSAATSLGISHRDALFSLVAQCRKKFPALVVEVEADDETQAEMAAEAGADIVLCDNMSPEAVRRVVEAVRGRAKVEASGRITLDNIGSYAAAGADYIAVGSITHSAPAIDISFEIRKAWCA
ncbi:MAG: nicotinate-nucleotide diphosphorylase (carboxylating) [Acidimicrobiia bacterium]